MGCKACQAKDQLVSSLEEQVEWLRVMIGTPRVLKSEQSAIPHRLYQSEEEEDIRFLQARGDIDPRHAEMLLESVGAFNTNVTIS